LKIGIGFRRAETGELEIAGDFQGKPLLRQKLKTAMYPSLSDNSTLTNNRERSGYPLSQAAKVLLALWSLCLLGGFSVAFGLEPDLRGYGTHQRLGLPPCIFREMFGVPCPSCGMTTSFSYFTRARIIEAFQANVAGLLLAVVCAVQIPWCWLSIYRGRLWKVSRPDISLMWLLLVLYGVCALAWVTRLIFV